MLRGRLFFVSFLHASVLLIPSLVSAAILAQQLDVSASDTPFSYLANPGSSVFYQPGVVRTGQAGADVRQIMLWIHSTNPNNLWYATSTGQSCNWLTSATDAGVGFYYKLSGRMYLKRYNSNLLCDYSPQAGMWRIYSSDSNPIVTLSPNMTYDLVGMRSEFDSHMSIRGAPVSNSGGYCYSAFNTFYPDCDRGASQSIGALAYFISSSATDTPAQSDPAVCIENCNDNVLFIPGIEATRLYRPDYNGGTDKLWEPSSDADAQDLALDNSGASIRNDIYAKDLIGEAYGTLNIYESFLADLAHWKADGLFADYGLAPYDWRLSLSDVLRYGREIDGRIYYSGDLRATSTPYIVQELRRLAGSSRSGKVTIIAHSNGGLVAKALVRMLEDTHDPLAEKIDKLILVAVPQTGTPTAIGALLHGFGQGIPTDWASFALSPSAARTFADTAPMAYHLLPSESYFSGVGASTQTPVVTFDPGTSTNAFIASYGASISSPTALANFLLGADGRTQPDATDLVHPPKLSAGLLSYAAGAHLPLDSWVPPASMQVYQIAGWGEDTIAGIRYANDRKCTVRSGLRCTQYEDALRYTPELTVDGDGTVAASSALAMSTSSPNVSRWWVNLRNYNNDHRLESGLLGRGHAGILEVPELRTLISGIISSSSLTTFSYISPFRPGMDASEKNLDFVLHSPLSLSVVDADGREVGYGISDIPGARFHQYGEVQYVSVPADAHPTLRLQGEKPGSFTLEVREVHGDTLVASSTIEGVPVAASSSATMHFEDGTLADASALTVDIDGDGTADTELAPEIGRTVGYLPPKLPLSVVADDKNILLGTKSGPLTAHIDGFVAGDTASSSTTGKPDCTSISLAKSVGTYPILCTIGTLASERYTFGTFVPGVLTVVYDWRGFLQPINDPARSVGKKPSIFRAGSTIPVKFKLFDSRGKVVRAATAPAWLPPDQGDPVEGRRNESSHRQKETRGDVYKWDGDDGQYVYNWNTKGLETGYWYTVYARLDDGSTYSVKIGLK